MSRWFRMYEETLDDPKVQKLAAEDFKAWVNLLCLTSRGGGTLPRAEDVAFALRGQLDETRSLLERLINAGLIDRRRGGFAPHGWAKRQYKSDTSRDRMRRHRQALRDVTVTAPVTPPESESESESEQTLQPPADGGLGPDRDSILLAEELCRLAGIASCGPAAIGHVRRWLADGIGAETIRGVVRGMCANAPAPTRSLKRFDQPVRRAAAERLAAAGPQAAAAAPRRAMNLDELGAAARWCDDHGEPARAAEYRRQAAALRAAARARRQGTIGNKV